MIYVASEMQRRGYDIPLMIGGATTSKAHTAVKIEPAYRSGPTIYVADASRGVTVATKLLSDNLRDGLVAEHRTEYATIRERNAKRPERPALLDYPAAVANAAHLDWSAYTPQRPAFTGLRVFPDYPLAELIEIIDWTPFFIAWDLAGKYPAILDDAKIGEAARALFKDASALLRRIVSEKLLVARAVLGFWPAARRGSDDVAVFADETREQEIALLHFLRQQKAQPDDRPNYCLADFVAPADGPADYIGAFAVSVGFGADELAAEFEHRHDDYGSIMTKALADRLAEALAEHLHRRVRTELWGYAPDELLGAEDLIRERYRGIRPAPGYPACPDHSEKATLFRLLDAERSIGITLTENFAMYPAASVSGWYFSHPKARYFPVGKIGRDQVESLAARKEVDCRVAERWLRPNLGYESHAQNTFETPEENRA